MNLTALLTALQQQMANYFGTILGRVSTVITRFNAHAIDYTNPHRVDKGDVGLSEVENLPPATKNQAEGGINNTSLMTPRRVDQYMEAKVYTPLAELFEQATNDLNS